MKSIFRILLLLLLAYVAVGCTQVCSTCRTEYGQYDGDSLNTVYEHENCGSASAISNWEEQERQDLLHYKKVSGVPFSECVCWRH
ncbi:MAG: hypothetical protein IPN95_03905 [Bacteroidetes bacterium]|nr:hypothetical protein [Bacteroidota bacterium]MBL0015891.1 hypothetical protein [Bacteroidota bacterium]MBP6639967.1 hypothetical protein [Bacteroidia bacterium]